MSELVASARKNSRHGYKAVVIYPDGHTQTLAARYRTSEDGRDTLLLRAAKNFSTREEAVAFAARWIAANEEKRAIRAHQLEQAHVTGRRPSEAEARAALAKAGV